MKPCPHQGEQEKGKCGHYFPMLNLPGHEADTTCFWFRHSWLECNRQEDGSDAICEWFEGRKEPKK